MRRKAVLIIHGFVGCLYDNEYLMNYLELDNKFDVFARTLPGHYENEMYQKATYQDWIDFTDKKIQDLIKFGYKEIYLIGHSMGGVLASLFATKYKEIKKINHFNSTPIGYQYQISFTIFVDGNLSTYDSHAIADKLEKEITNNNDDIYLTVIHVNPIDINKEYRTKESKNPNKR